MVKTEVAYYTKTIVKIKERIKSIKVKIDNSTKSENKK